MIMKLLSHVFPARLAHRDGSVAIEAMGLTLVLLSALVVIILIGSGFWNLTLLNSAATSASLASQTLVNQDCTGLEPGTCDDSRGRAVINAIVLDTQKQMIYGEGALSQAGTSIGPPDCRNQVQFPENAGFAPSTGWGYSFVSLRSQFKPLGSDVEIPIRAASLSVIYQPVCN